MKDLELLKSLEAIFHLETRSFVRYVYEAASPLAKDDWGRMLAGRLEAWYIETRGHLGALVRLLEAEDFVPGPSNWPLSHAQCNLLAYSRIVDIVRSRMAPTFAAIEREALKLESWPEASEAVAELLKTERKLLDEFEKLADDRPSDEPETGPRRQVSANFW